MQEPYAPQTPAALLKWKESGFLNVVPYGEFLRKEGGVMELREKSKEFLSSVPAPKAHLPEHTNIPISSRMRGWIAVSFSVVGIVCIFFTDQIHSALPYILGSVMLALGVIDTGRGILTKEHLRRDTKLTANGIVFFLLGIVVLCNRGNADHLIGAIWGTLGLVKGSEELNRAIYRFAHKEHYLGKLLRAGIELLLGFLLLIDPVSSIHHHLFILGLELISMGWRTWRETGTKFETKTEES